MNLTTAINFLILLGKQEKGLRLQRYKYGRFIHLMHFLPNTKTKELIHTKANRI